ncbi:MAG TPA: hypothetical protein VHN99_05490 [Deinococcales bacterium]|nr:hypothetical protein [Deinococcales bacterium]
MPQNLTGTASWLDAVPAPADGDSVVATSVNNGLQALANQAQWLKANLLPKASPVATGWPTGFIPGYSSVASLQAATGQPDGALARLSGSGVDFGIYVYQASLIATSDNVNVIRPNSVANDTLAGRWVSVTRGLRGLALGFAGLDANGNLVKLAAPTEPTFTVAAGQTGTLNRQASTAVTARGGDWCTFRLDYQWTPAATTTAWTRFQVAGIAAGWVIASLSFGSATVASDGLARYSALYGADTLHVRNESTALQSLTAFVTLGRS